MNNDKIYSGYKVRYSLPGCTLLGYITSTNNSKGEWYFTNGSMGALVKDRSSLEIVDARKRSFKDAFKLSKLEAKHALNATGKELSVEIPNENIIEPQYESIDGYPDLHINFREYVKTHSPKQIASTVSTLAVNGAINLIDKHGTELADSTAAAWSLSRGVRVIVGTWQHELQRELRRLNLVPVVVAHRKGEEFFRLSEA